MKFRLLATGFALGIGAAMMCSQALSQDQAGQAPSPEQMQDMMKQWMASTQPGPQHKMMESSIGTWDTTTKMWMAGPGGDPTETKGVAERKWVLDGRFIMEELKSEFPMEAMSGGQAKNIPWNGMGLFGYDRFRNMYVGCWADTMGTQLLTMKGTASPDGTVFTYYGEMDEPMMGVIGRTVKFQTKVVDNDTHVFSIYDLHAGDDYKVVEVTYKRRK